ncbi:hypothetical protein JXR01_00415 [Candidatus Kaiserbacteria bacterium]|nr:MAG: hypothetical protein JXR01_00415 [Candidatus Kaiserbacteria bacterium]
MMANSEKLSTASTDSVEAVSVAHLSDTQILEALKGKGPLKEILGFVEQIPRSATPDIIISEDASEDILKKLLESSSAGSYVEDNRERIKSVIERAYALIAWKHIAPQGEEMISVNDDSKLGYKLFKEFENKLNSAPLGQSVAQIAALVSTPKDTTKKKKGVAPDDLDAEGAEKMGNLITAINKTMKDGTPDAKRVVIDMKEWVRKLPGGTPRANSRKAAATEVAEQMDNVVSLFEEDLRKMPKYVQQNMAPHKLLGIPIPFLRRGQVLAGKTGVARGIEMGTTVMETSSLVAASSFILAAAMATPLTITPSSNFTAWSAAALAAFTVFASQSYIFKQQSEQALVEAKTKIGAIGKAIAAHPVSYPFRGLVTGASTFTIFLALVGADRSVERAQDIAALIEPHRAAIENELNQVTQQTPGKSAASKLFSWISSIVPSGIGDTQEFALLNDVAEIPTELRHRMEIAVRAEAGDADAQAQAKNWGIPYSSTAGLGPKALSLAALVGISVNDAEALTGSEAMTTGEITPGIAQTRQQIRAFAERHELNLTDDQMENPQFVMNALVMKFQNNALGMFEEFGEQRSELTRVLRLTASMNILDSLYSTFAKFQPPVDPKEIPYRLNALESNAEDIAQQYNEQLANPAEELSLIVANGFKSIYGRNVNVSEISISPPPLNLDFTEIKKLAKIIQDATNNITADDVEVGGSMDNMEAELESDLSDIDQRIENVTDLLDPRNEIDEIVARRYGSDISEEERQSMVAFEILKNATLALSIEFIALLTMLGAAAGRLKEMENAHGSKQVERIEKAEEKIVQAFTKQINKQIAKYRQIVNQQKKNGVELPFPFEDVTDVEVKRALRSVGHKEFVKMGFIAKAIARGPFLRKIDTSNRYSDFLYALKSPKNSGKVIDELFPGWGAVLGHFNKVDGAEDKRKHKKGERWLKPKEINPLKDKRVCEIAVLTEQNRRSISSIEVHEVLLEKLKGGIFGNRSIQNSTELLPHEASKMEGDNLHLHDEEWKDLIFSAGDGSVLDDLNRRLEIEQGKVETRTKRIESLYRELEDNPIFGRTLEVEKQIGGAFRSGGLKVMPRKTIEGRIKSLLDMQSKGSLKAPFDSFDGYISSLLKRLEGARSIEEKGIDKETMKQADKQMKFIQEIIEKTTDGFSEAMRKEFGSYRIEKNITNDTNGVSLRLRIKDGNKKIVAEESVQLSAIFTSGLSDKDKSTKDAIAKELAGSNIWKEISDGKYTFVPNHNIQTPLLKTYNELWQKLLDTSEVNSSNSLREEIKAMLQERKRDSIPTELIGTGMSKDVALQNINEGMKAYLGHREMERTLTNVNLDTASSAQLKEIKGALEQRRSAVRLTKEDDVRKEELEKFINRLYSNPEYLNQLNVTFDFITQKFSTRLNRGFNLRNRYGRAMNHDQFEIFLQEFEQSQ